MRSNPIDFIPSDFSTPFKSLSFSSGMLRLFQGDCLAVMPTNLTAKSVDLIATDLPFGSTNNAWDIRIDLPKLCQEYARILKPTGCVVLNADLKFVENLKATAPKMIPFKYEIVWLKTHSTGFLGAKHRPLRQHEYLVVFGHKGTTFNPQKVAGAPYKGNKGPGSSLYGKPEHYSSDNKGTRYPTTLLSIPSLRPAGRLHPSQKPLQLCRWVLRTYSNPGETVLDNAIGSGTMGVAALQEGRLFVGIEQEPSYFTLAEQRIRGCTWASTEVRETAM
jgi:site-specific DNA-methyltransferase (adenine-specific)